MYSQVPDHTQEEKDRSGSTSVLGAKTSVLGAKMQMRVIIILYTTHSLLSTKFVTHHCEVYIIYKFIIFFPKTQNIFGNKINK